jgi:hypothetical protein
MSNTRNPRPDAAREADRVFRYRRQDAIAELKRVLGYLPRESLQIYLSIMDAHAVLPRHGIPETHAIKIATAIVLYVLRFGLQSHVFTNCSSA